MRLRTLRWMAWGLLAAGLLTLRPQLPSTLAQQQAQAFVQFGSDEEEGLSGVFLPTERTAQRRLDQARTLMTEERYSEAVRILDLILDNHEDSFFQPEGRDTNFRSLKAEARRLIGSLPEAGRQAYQLQFGVRAAKLLEQAARSGDVQQLAEVSRRYFHTEAGYTATLLLGQHQLDHNRPLAAALAFQQLIDVGRPAAQFEPTLSVLAATSWERAGMADKAQQTLAALRATQPQARLQVGGKETPLFDREGEALVWLQQTVGKGRETGPAQAEQWTMYRGSGGRNAQSAGGRPLLAPRWRVRTANDPTIEKLVQQMRQSYLRQEIAALPSLQPLAVRNVVLMRTAQHLLAVDFETGKRIWEVKPRQDEAFERLIKSSRSQAELDQMPQLAISLEQRMWDDATYGTLSSDGERVFVLQDLDLLIGAPNQRVQFMIAGGGVVGGQRVASTGPKTYNRLAAFDLATEGKLLWEVGGPESEDDPLAGAFFLGAPLPLSDQLYVLAEIKGGIRLVVLDAKTGKLEWTQQLADLERNIIQDPFRRLAGAMPSFTDGVLVCPTSAGAVIAVDLSTRSLLWAYKYPVEMSTSRNQMAMMMMRGYPASHTRANDAWTDASVTIVDGRVLLTPIESDKIYCLDLLDGSLVWEAERNEGLYVACVHDDQVIIVGAHDVRALSLEDGSLAWNNSTLDLPDGSLPSGRGYYSGQHYYLPLSSAEVAKIDLDKGKIVDRAESRDGHIPGNLVCYRGEVLSQGVDFLESYFQVEALQERVKLALQKNPDDAEALARQGELQFDARQLAASVASLRRSFELDPNDLTRTLLVRSLLAGLRQDFVAHRDSLAELHDLVDQPEQRVELVRLTALGQQRSGAILPAFENYLRLVDLADGDDQLEQVDEHSSVRRSRWVQAQLAALYETASADERAQMDAALAARYAALGEEASPSALRQFLNYFGSTSLADQARLRLAAALLETERTLECELLVRDLERAADPQLQRAAVALMARLLHKTGRIEDAAHYYGRLAGPLAELVCLDGETGSELLAELHPEDPVRTYLETPQSWPRGEVTASTGSAKGQSRTHRRMFPLELRDPLGPFYRNTTVAFDQQGQAVVGHDALGNQQYQIPLNQPNTARRSYVVNPNLNYGKTYGHLLIISMGYQILALDTLNTAQADWQNVLWKQDLTEQMPGMPMHRRVQIKRVNLPGGDARYQAEDDQGRPIGTLGPIIPQGITFQRFRSLVAVDPLTGETLWQRDDIPAGSDLFGDEQRLLVVPPSSAQALVLRPLDGSLLGTCPVPAVSQRLATLGAQILKLENTSRGPKLTLLDPWKRQELWSRSFAVGAKLLRLDHDKLAVMQRDGQFVLLSLADGRPLVEEQLVAEPQLTDIYMQQSSDHFVLLTNRPPQPNEEGVSISAAPGGLDNPLVSGHVYVFDRATGKPRWQVPASIEQQGLMLPQPAELPVLVFVRHVTNPSESGRHRTKTSVLCLDKRTGQAVFEKDDFGFGTGFFSLVGDPGAQRVSVLLPATAVHLQYTDEPQPPEPPLQAGLLADPPRRNKSLQVIGSLFKALGRAASEVNGVPVDEVDDNPFGPANGNRDPFGGDVEEPAIVEEEPRNSR